MQMIKSEGGLEQDSVSLSIWLTLFVADKVTGNHRECSFGAEFVAIEQAMEV